MKQNKREAKRGTEKRRKRREEERERKEEGREKENPDILGFQYRFLSL